jgi:hypothetical protein
MTSSVSSSSSAKKRSPSQENTPRNIRLKKSGSETSSLSTEDPIDAYRTTLQNEGFAEIDIPETLQKEIDAVNTILRANHDNDCIDKKQKKPETYILRNGGHLNEIDKKKINDLSNNLKIFIHSTLSGIFKDKLIVETLPLELLIRTKNNSNNIFHKDSSHIFNDNIINNITAIYPMLDQKGTMYVPYDKKDQYPATEENKYPIKEENKIDNVYIYARDLIKNEDVKHLDPSKIAVFLCRNASEYLGKEYDDKSLIHAVPEPDDSQESRIYILARFGIADKQPTQP